MTIRELQHLQFLLKIFIELECSTYSDIDDLELTYTINRIYNIIIDKEKKNNLPYSTTTIR